MKNKPAPRDVSYQERLLEDLQDPKEAALYLEAAIDDGDAKAFLVALRDVAKARGFASVAQKARLGRESLYKTLSKQGNPELRTVNKLLHAMGMRLTVEAA